MNPKWEDHQLQSSKVSYANKADCSSSSEGRVIIWGNGQLKCHEPGGGGQLMEDRPSLPAIVFNHVGQFNDELPLFILLAGLECMFLEQRQKNSQTWVIINHK